MSKIFIKAFVIIKDVLLGIILIALALTSFFKRRENNAKIDSLFDENSIEIPDGER